MKHGPAGLHDRSRRPSNSPNHITEPIVAALLQARCRHLTWGAKKLLTLLAKRFPVEELPARTTVSDILGRHGMLAKKRQSRHVGHPGDPSGAMLAPNERPQAEGGGAVGLDVDLER